jgi:hypothetical protein
MACRPKRYIYHIIKTSQGKQYEDVFYADTAEKVNKKFKEMLKENKKVKFPVRYINNGGLKDANYELVIIKRREKNEKPEVKIRDDYGKFVNYVSTDDDWVIYDRSPYDKEETFWVYGYHPQLQRKDFNWIFDEFILKGAHDKYKFREVVIFKNKLLIKQADKLDMVMCKNKSDCVRLYNTIEEESKKKNLKYIMFNGDGWEGQQGQYWFNQIQKLTNWSKLKILRRNLRP